MAAVDSQTSAISPLSSDCASDRIAPYAYWPATTFTQVQNDPRLSPQDKTCSLDQDTRSRLLQLYTTRTPISSPKQIQSHFTCHYLTRSNIQGVLDSRTQTINRYGQSNSSFSSLSSRLDDLKKLLQQSWRVSFGSLDFLELIWTGHRPSKNWADLLSACTCDKRNIRTVTSCPLGIDEDEFLALNLSVTYFYTMDGQPTMSLIAIAMTRDAYNSIVEHINSREALATSPSSFTSSIPSTPTMRPLSAPDFDRTPFVHRDLLLPTLCRWRNASISSILNSAAESKAWSTKVLPEEHVSPDWDDMDLDTSTSTKSNTADEDDEAYFFPTIRPESSGSISSERSLSSITNKSAAPSPDQQPRHHGRHLPSLPIQTYELRAALVSGRDPIFRSIASNISITLDRQWIRKSSQFDQTRNSNRHKNSKSKAQN